MTWIYGNPTDADREWANNVRRVCEYMAKRLGEGPDQLPDTMRATLKFARDFYAKAKPLASDDDFEAWFAEHATPLEGLPGWYQVRL